MPETPTTESSPAFLGRTVLAAIGAVVAINLGAFLLFYGDTLSSVALPYREDFSHTTRLDYREFGGDWRIADGALVQGDASLPDQFAVLTAHLPVVGGTFGATMHFTSPKQGGGLMFGMAKVGDRHGSQLVRFGRGDDDKPYLVYGAFDQQLQFQAQGTVPLPELGETARLALTIRPDTYDVLLDGTPVAQGVPVLFSGGNVALSTWFSSVSFDDIALDAAGQAATASQPDPAQAAPAATAAPAPVTTTVPAPAATFAPVTVVQTTDPGTAPAVTRPGRA